MRDFFSLLCVKKKGRVVSGGQKEFCFLQSVLQTLILRGRKHTTITIFPLSSRVFLVLVSFGLLFSSLPFPSSPPASDRLLNVFFAFVFHVRLMHEGFFFTSFFPREEGRRRRRGASSLVKSGKQLGTPVFRQEGQQ